MNIDKFVDLVENMRQAQKNYSMTNEKKHKIRAGILEELVDLQIEEYKGEKPAPPQEGTLNFV